MLTRRTRMEDLHLLERSRAVRPSPYAVPYLRRSGHRSSSPLPALLAGPEPVEVAAHAHDDEVGGRVGGLGDVQGTLVPAGGLGRTHVMKQCGEVVGDHPHFRMQPTQQSLL